MLQRLRKLFRFVASFGFACILLLFLLLLTFLGTLEQVDHGLYEVQKKYFESIVLVHDFGPWDLRLPRFSGGEFSWSHHPFGPIPCPLPGVYLLLALLLLNLLAGGIVRLRKDRAHIGILIIHLGMVLMLVAGYVKFVFSIEGSLALLPHEFDGQVKDPRFARVYESDEFESYFDWEIAIHEAVADQPVTELLIPAADFQYDVAHRAVTYRDLRLPFDLTITRYEPNCRPFPDGTPSEQRLQDGTMHRNYVAAGPVVDGFFLGTRPLEKEGEANLAGAYVTFRERQTSAETRAILWFAAVYPWDPRVPYTLTAGGKPWVIDLRKRRWKLPFKVRLDEFTFERHPRTKSPRVFLSDVTKFEQGQEQRLKITMNEPLRREGYTLYQASYGPQNAKVGEELWSTFAVVRNPSDQWPTYSCIVIAIGLLYHFSIKLLRYVKSENRRVAT